MANEYRKELINEGNNKLKQMINHPLFGFVILTIILAGVQLLFMFMVIGRRLKKGFQTGVGYEMPLSMLSFYLLKLHPIF